jgi:LytS/YehU family sensor histidine kinase
MISRLGRLNATIPWWGYWVFFIVIGLLILANEENFQDKDWYAVSIVTYFFLIFFMVVRWIFQQIRQTLKLRKEKAQMESLHLQSQVNPHFFFNILNNLYGWIGKDPKQAQKMILKLSEMMRYSIYEGQDDYVSIEKEMDYLKNYIELHKMRYLKSIDINFETNVQDPSLGIRPLLFIILLENAFKHGVENLTNNAFVNINLTSTDSLISFSVENNFDPETVSTESGIGLSNLQKRLLLTYPKNHKLEIENNGKIYKATLTINLK